MASIPTVVGSRLTNFLEIQTSYPLGPEIVQLTVLVASFAVPKIRPGVAVPGRANENEKLVTPGVGVGTGVGTGVGDDGDPPPPQAVKTMVVATTRTTANDERCFVTVASCYGVCVKKLMLGMNINLDKFYQRLYHFKSHLVKNTNVAITC